MSNEKQTKQAKQASPRLSIVIDPALRQAARGKAVSEGKNLTIIITDFLREYLAKK